MKKIIFYLLIATNYFSLGVDSITNENLVSLLILIVLLLIGIFITHSKELKFIHNSLFYFSVFLVYPSVLSLSTGNGEGIKKTLGALVNPPSTNINMPSIDFIKLLGALCLLLFLIFMVKKYSLSREVLWLILVIISLNKSLFTLYMFAKNYYIDNVIFHGVCYLLLITTNKSFKVIKKPKVKKVKPEV